MATSCVEMSARRRAVCRRGSRGGAGHEEFLRRITRSLYYGKLPAIPCLSLPVMELSADIFSEAQKGKSLKRLYLEDATELTRNACVSPCSLVLAIVYLERLKTFNPEYVANMAPTELFLVSLMVSSKFLQDSGEEDEVFSDEWAASAGISPQSLNRIEKDFLHAIDWRVFVSEEQFNASLACLEHSISLRQAKLRGWFTYSDLANISSTCDTLGIMKCLATVYAALSISYIASIYSIMASSFIVSQSLLAISMSTISLRAFEPTPNYIYDETILNETSDFNSDVLKNEIINHDLSLTSVIKNSLVSEKSLTSYSNETVSESCCENYLRPIYLSFLQKILQLPIMKNIFFQPQTKFMLNNFDMDNNNLTTNGCRDDSFLNNHYSLWSPLMVY